MSLRRLSMDWVPKKINRAYPMTAGAVFECVLV